MSRTYSNKKVISDVVKYLKENEGVSITFQQDNPKKPGFKSFERYEKYKSATNYQEFSDMGGKTGKSGDLKHDYERGYLTIEFPVLKPVEVVAVEEVEDEAGIVEVEGVEECPICYNPIGDTDVFVTKCGHKFCTGCAIKHLCNSKACPMCRSDMADAPISVGRPATGPGSVQQISEHSYQFGYDDGYDEGYHEGRAEVEAFGAQVGERMIQMVQENIRLKELLRQNNIEQ